MSHQGFQWDDTAFRTQWDTCLTPSPDVLRGRWTVRMLTGSIPNFSWAGHCKDFPEPTAGQPFLGNNRVLGFIKFGWFCVDQQTTPEAILELDYSRGQKKNIVFGHMRDHLRQIQDGVLLGAYYFVEDNKLQFKGWFGLEKQE